MFIEYLTNDSALVSSVYPERAGWTPEMMLLAEAVDTLRILVWQNSKDAQEGKNFPEKIERPGVVRPKPRNGSRVKAQPLSAIKKIYGEQKSDDIERQRKLAALFRG